MKGTIIPPDNPPTPQQPITTHTHTHPSAGQLLASSFILIPPRATTSSVFGWDFRFFSRPTCLSLIIVTIFIYKSFFPSSSSGLTLLWRGYEESSYVRSIKRENYKHIPSTTTKLFIQNIIKMIYKKHILLGAYEK